METRRFRSTSRRLFPGTRVHSWLHRKGRRCSRVLTLSTTASSYTLGDNLSSHIGQIRTVRSMRRDFRLGNRIRVSIPTLPTSFPGLLDHRKPDSPASCTRSMEDLSSALTQEYIRASMREKFAYGGQKNGMWRFSLVQADRRVCCLAITGSTPQASTYTTPRTLLLNNKSYFRWIERRSWKCTASIAVHFTSKCGLG